ncbi:putative toxin-antitoxin system toxin component, PIN family [Sphingobium sp. GW456-12-10-14-TSB1]|jgi:putative PIN family toxin of toxin-antitoxin system|uniref:PIN domain-containing protein n=2 Tax=Sphingomonadaceae TaxID=41297 RepID=A0A1E1EY07_9SPHN|nr:MULTISPECIES: putative toxin-antitoxin system toxin component, PIN family [Sphingomonadaceae]MYL97795.1 putative toxin-antitoxin system toxin component, PIN family [Novosphingobium silvae]OUC54419.1 putative toxin-antitoxin system toxin component, PIN family [Sphingobium sp. GW456-12-10-14-TSB1]BAV63155.1 hypothetical protein SCLO_1001150 [Sphingobium cloacae]HPB23881.1 putative toxin-antitoxin system toxin component, PIN family [Novosphingobium sp.]
MKGDAFVLDTNVLISAALSAESPPARVTHWVIANARLIFAEPTFEEFRSRLWRPKFDRYLTIERRNQILHDFSAIADWVELNSDPLPVSSRDPDDDMFIRAAIAGSARWLVSGDRDLLEVQGLPAPTIVSPADMLKRISA